jgi:hypothetical protein
MDNACPACGKEILGGNDFRELMRVRGFLQDLELDEGTIVSVAAAISQKYDLVAKSERKPSNRLPTPEEIDSLDGLDEEERARLRALRAAQIERKAEEDARAVREWGLDQGTLGVTGSPSAPVDPQMAALFEPGVIADGDLPDPLPGRETKATINDARLARAEAMKMDPGRFKVLRAE